MATRNIPSSSHNIVHGKIEDFENLPLVSFNCYFIKILTSFHLDRILLTDLMFMESDKKPGFFEINSRLGKQFWTRAAKPKIHQTKIAVTKI